MTGPCPYGNQFCGQPGWSTCGACHDDLRPSASGPVPSNAVDVSPQEQAR